MTLTFALKEKPSIRKVLVAGQSELGMDKIKLLSPVFHGDTLYSYSEVLETKPADREDAGIVRFKHYGTKQDGKQVFEGERTVMIKRRSHWGNK